MSELYCRRIEAENNTLAETADYLKTTQKGLSL